MPLLSKTKLKRRGQRPQSSARAGDSPTITVAPELATAIEILPVSELKAYKRKLKNHKDEDVHHIAWSIMEFGFNNPIIIDADSVVVAGHGRLAAALQIGLATVPVIRLTHLTPERLQAYRIADNVLASRVQLDREVLRVELVELLSLDLPFDVEVTGLKMAEIDLIIDPVEEHGSDPDDDLPKEPAIAVSRLGDVWTLGRHRLACADARDSWSGILGGRLATAVITDSPYNLPARAIGGLGSIKHGDFQHGSGEMSRPEFVTFLADVHARLAENCQDGALLYSFIDWKHQRELLEAGERVGLNYYNLIVWNKSNAGMGSMYRSKYELVVLFKKGLAPHQNNVQLGKYGRWRANVWDYAGANTFRRGRMEELGSHPTPKTVRMLEDALRDCTKRGDLVLDAFMGSGSTMIAAERCGRVAAGTEIDPIYCDVIIRRWEARTGEKAVHVETGLSFAHLEERRASTDEPGAPRAQPELLEDAAA